MFFVLFHNFSFTVLPSSSASSVSSSLLTGGLRGQTPRRSGSRATRCWLSWRLFGSACPATPSPLRWLESERTAVSDTARRRAEEDVGYECRHAGHHRALGDEAGELEPRTGERGGAQTSPRIPGSYAAGRQGASRAAAEPFECWRKGKPSAIAEAARGQSGPVRRERRGGEERRRVELDPS